MTHEELSHPRRARRRAGHPRGRGGADDPGGHRARRRCASTRSWSRASRWSRWPPGPRWRTRSTLVVEEGHSRIPVYEDTIDEIIGILYAKDLLPFLKGSVVGAAGAAIAPPDAGLRARVDERRRPAPRVPAAQGPHRDRARRVRRDRRPGHDRGPARGDRRRDPGRVRRGGAADRPDSRTTRRGSTGGPTSTTWPSCSTPNLGLEDEDEYDTVGGLIYHRIGGVPKPGDQVAVDGLTLTVETTDGRRVGKVLAVRQRETDEPEDDEADR